MATSPDQHTATSTAPITPPPAPALMDSETTTTSRSSVTAERDGHPNGTKDAHVGAPDGSNGHVHAVPALEAQEEERPQRSKLKITLIMLSLGIAVLLVALDITIVTTALPTIAERFNSASGYTWVGSAYLIANSAATPIWGKVSDIFGRKPILLTTNAVFFVGSLLAAVSVNMNMLIAARVVQGIGGGGLIVLVNITISDLFAMRDRGAYFGMIGGVWALASSLGPVVGGALTQKVSWRWCFYIVSIRAADLWHSIF
jgi:predicted MFS family arabinose efflux permease